MVAFALVRGTSSRLAELNPQIQEGLQVLEVDTGKMKIGDGLSHWNELDYYLPESHILAAIHDAIAQIEPGGGIGPGQHQTSDLVLHINSTAPHPIYDDGPSLILLYQNAKV